MDQTAVAPNNADLSALSQSQRDAVSKLREETGMREAFFAKNRDYHEEVAFAKGKSLYTLKDILSFLSVADELAKDQATIKYAVEIAHSIKSYMDWVKEYNGECFVMWDNLQDCVSPDWSKDLWNAVPEKFLDYVHAMKDAREALKWASPFSWRVRTLEERSPKKGRDYARWMRKRFTEAAEKGMDEREWIGTAVDAYFMRGMPEKIWSYVDQGEDVQSRVRRAGITKECIDKKFPHNSQKEAVLKEWQKWMGNKIKDATSMDNALDAAEKIIKYDNSWLAINKLSHRIKRKTSPSERIQAQRWINSVSTGFYSHEVKNLLKDLSELADPFLTVETLLLVLGNAEFKNFSTQMRRLDCDITNRKIDIYSDPYKECSRSAINVLHAAPFIPQIVGEIITSLGSIRDPSMAVKACRLVFQSAAFQTTLQSYRLGATRWLWKAVRKSRFLCGPEGHYVKIGALQKHEEWILGHAIKQARKLGPQDRRSQELSWINHGLSKKPDNVWCFIKRILARNLGC